MSAAPVAWGSLLLAAYLLGSVSFSYLVVRILRGTDVRTVGSGNAGATNVMRAAGKLAGVVVLALDLGKGIAAVAAARALGAGPAVVAGCAVAVVVGHVFPVFLGFRGGKGVATAAGAMGTLAPPALAPALGVFLVVVAATRYVSLGSVAAAVAFPLVVLAGRAAGWLPADDGLLATVIAVAALVVWKHRDNLARLRAGTERRLGAPRDEATAIGGGTGGGGAGAIPSGGPGGAAGGASGGATRQAGEAR